MNIADEIRQQIEKNKGLKLEVGEINNHLSILEGLVRKDIEEQKNEAYQRGFEEGKAQTELGCEGCKHEGSSRALAPCHYCTRNSTDYWTAKQTDDEIKVGDEVKPFYTDITGVVTLIDGDTIYVLWRDGSSTSTLKLKEVVKTDRHFDIASILKEMQND